MLLDLGLPDAEGIDGLRKLLAVAGSAAVCVLTGRSDEHLGVAAVAEGAQDYLVKGQVDGVLLIRALRYAVERKRADENTQPAARGGAAPGRVGPAGARPAAPAADAHRPRSRCTRSTAPGRALGLLGGDFFDVVQVGDDRLHVIVGDVCGHSVDEAALGVELRVAWRALVLGRGARGPGPRRARAGADERAPGPRGVRHRRHRSSLDLPANRATVRLAGHPPPVLLVRWQGRAGRPPGPASCSAYGPRPPPRPTWSSPAMTGPC